MAEPATVVISQATSRLVQGFFTCEALGPQNLKNVAAPLELYRVRGEGEAHTRFEVSVQKGLTPLVGRDLEVGLLRERWAQAKRGEGQVVLLSGEPGIGKSRLMQELKKHVSIDGATRIEFHCSPYHQNTALYPITEHLQRLLQFQSADTPPTKLAKLAQFLSQYRFPQAETVPLLAALFSLPLPEGVPPLSFSPQKQKQLTLEALVAWLLEEAERAVVYCTWEDLHWADPSTLEILTLFLGQVTTTRVLTLLTFRPEFTSPWGNRSHLSQMTLSRLGRQHVETMVGQVTRGKALPSEVVQQIVAKTDGVPLFVEELTKSVVESEVTVGARHASPLQLAVPATLQDALMARLDRLGSAKAVAQFGATIGREFSYELLHAVSNGEERSLQRGLKQLVEAELLYQRGLPPQAHYLFKHALIQDTAYQSLLKSTRQQYHQQIVHVLEERFPDTKENQPELLAHHHTEAGLKEQAIPYWQKAGERASQRSAYVEAVSHVTQGLTLLSTLPQTPARAQQELRLQLMLSNTLSMTKGPGSTEREQVLIRARELCQQVGETSDLFWTLLALLFGYLFRAEFSQARKLAEQMLPLAQSTQIPHLLMGAYWGMGETLLWMGEFGSARVHVEQGIALYETQQYRPQEHPGPINPLAPCFFNAAYALWMQGYPDQALKRIQEALGVARELAQPFGLAVTLNFAAGLHLFRRDAGATRDAAEELITLSTEQGFPDRIAIGMFYRGWALTMQGQEEEGLAQMRQGWAGWRAAGAKVTYTARLASFAEEYGQLGRPEEGLPLLAEAMELVNTTGERYYEAELYRVKGELLLTQEGSRLQAIGHREKTEEAEECFLKAIEIAQRQQAKSLELRAATSLARLWQSQGKHHAAYDMLSEIYHWFTEGFDTKDLQEAKALLDELSRRGW
ncbi:MAG: AAA family ATPase [Deltaproteobacteria bacterium]|nr:AAA family ATPase [Deltaproteobacteria bacterium]